MKNEYSEVTPYIRDLAELSARNNGIVPEMYAQVLPRSLISKQKKKLPTAARFPARGSFFTAASTCRN